MVGILPIILVTTAIASTVLVLPLTSLDTVESDNVTMPEVQDTVAGVYSDTVSSLLEEAGNEITDEEIAGYYQHLRNEYNLNNPSPEPVEEDAPYVIPVEDINQTALCSMLEEAGSSIKDEEIADFYYRFLDKAGWEIEPEE